MRGFSTFATSSAVLLACAAASAADISEQILASAKPYIERANEEWLPAMKRQDAKTIASPYASDGIFLTAAGETFIGRDAIEGFYRQRFAKGGHVIGGSLSHDGEYNAGSLIYEWGHAETQIELADGSHATRKGSYLTVWQRNAEGIWQIIRNLTF